MTEAPPAQTPTERTGALWWVRQTLSWTALLAICAIILIAVVIPWAAGAQRYTVLTGSMTPTYPPGSLLVVKPTDLENYAAGTAITYQLKSGEPAVVTHRIIAVKQDTLGNRTFITRGDANTRADSEPVVPEQIRGRVWYGLPYLGHVNNWLTGGSRAAILVVAISGLFGYALWMFTSDFRDGRRARREAEG